MMITYKAFLENLDRFYDIGSIIEIPMSEYLSKENEVIYNQAIADGYIMMFWSERKMTPMMRVVKMPDILLDKDFAEIYFGKFS